MYTYLNAYILAKVWFYSAIQSWLCLENYSIMIKLNFLQVNLQHCSTSKIGTFNLLKLAFKPIIKMGLTV